ncbi:MAG: hypothetical protein JWQ02_2531 [Capsulimonas sp.]|nr:hypothetical protein [Capsulimonas sp.]
MTRLNRMAFAPALALLTLGGLSLVSCGHRPAVVAQSGDPAPSDPAANALWTGSLKAASDTPVQAHVVIVARDAEAGRDRRSVLEMIEGSEGRFRLTYSEPAEARGRVVVCDGKTTWQYEPRSRTVLRRPTPESVSAETGSVDPDPLWRRDIEPQDADVSGRPAHVLRVRSTDGSIVERLWIDSATGRSLRTESYDRNGSLVRRVELSQVMVKPVVTAATFQPIIPPGARVLIAAVRPSPDVAREARLLDLPPQTAGFRVQSVVRSPKSPSAAIHVLYSNGPRALSVFVTENASDGSSKLIPTAGANWSSASLTPSVQAFTQERPDGQSAVAWVGDGRRYVAVGRMPLTDLMSIARPMASE